ncbi:hypothetical protein ACFQ3Z_24955 [Streptomyces nogalater]
MGGTGKSTVALALARRVAARRAVWWVDAATPATFVAALREVAVQAGVERAEAREVWRNHEAARDVLWDALNSSTAGPWLLVVDNADDPAVVRDWIRRGRGQHGGGDEPRPELRFLVDVIGGPCHCPDLRGRRRRDAP